MGDAAAAYLLNISMTVGDAYGAYTRVTACSGGVTAGSCEVEVLPSEGVDSNAVISLVEVIVGSQLKAKVATPPPLKMPSFPPCLLRSEPKP